jgi:hypothetical protein
MIHGVPTATWNSWAKGYTGEGLSLQQELWLQDYNRTQAQKDYHETSGGWDTAAYVYTGYIDMLLGTEAVITGEKVNDEIIPAIKEAAPYALGASALGLLALVWVASR